MVDDERLFMEVREAVRAVPPGPLVEAAKAAFAWHNVDAELAELTYDSAVEPAGALAGARADPAALRALTFLTSAITIEVELTSAGLQGHVVPPQPGEIEMQLRDGSRRTVPVDDDGWFLVLPRPAGMFRLYLHTAEGGTALTTWTVL
jgi:hypothetical protein